MNRTLYFRVYMREYRRKKRELRIAKSGHCPVCGILLDQEYEYLHKGCPFMESSVYAEIVESRPKITVE